MASATLLHTSQEIRFNMVPRSVKSHASTVRTIDDVFSQLEIDLREDASLIESRDRIRRLTKNNTALESESIDQLQSIRNIVAPVCPNGDALIKSMFRNKVVLGGVQATSFFYPMCTFTQAPWDFFCPSKGGMGDDFVNGLVQFSGLDVLEDLTSGDGTRVVYLRGSVNGTTEPINVRVYISSENPIQCVFNYEMSYQQTFISPVAAVCFWPRLNKKGYYRVFKSNTSQHEFPRGKTVFTVNIKKMSKTHPKVVQTTPSIYNGISDRIEAVIFKNELKLDKVIYKAEASKIESIVYAVSQDSTRYLGSTSGM